LKIIASKILQKITVINKDEQLDSAKIFN